MVQETPPAIRRLPRKDWISYIYLHNREASPSKAMIRLYKELQVAIAHHEMVSGRLANAVDHLSRASNTCLNLGDLEGSSRLLDRIRDIHVDMASRLGRGDRFEAYRAALQVSAGEALNAGDLSRMRNIFVQLAVLYENTGDTRARKYYLAQIRAIDTIHSVKGTHNITIQHIFLSRLVDSLHQANERRELAFRSSYTAQAKILDPIASHELLLPLPAR